MADLGDDDFDIDELLDEIDSSGTKGKAETPASVPSSVDKQNPSSSSGKSVRWAGETDGGSGGGNEDDFLAKLPRSQRDPSPTLRTMFITPDSNQSSTSKNTVASKPPLPSAPRGRSAANLGGTSSKDDWLGIQDGKDSLTNTPPSQPKSGTTQQEQKSGGNSSEEENSNSLFRDLGLRDQSTTQKRRSGVNFPTTKETPPEQPKVAAGGGFPQRNRPLKGPPSAFGESVSNTPPMSLGEDPFRSSGPSQSKPFSSSVLDELGKSPLQSPKSSLEFNKVRGGVGPPPKSIPAQPFSATASSFGGDPGGGMQAFPPPPRNQAMPTFPPKLPSAESIQFSLNAPPPTPPEPNNPPQQNPPKKKVAKGGGASVVAAQQGSTLQLPSHLINEDELKGMSASLKTLYANQLEMLEKSYREQMQFLSEANRRKEELLKEEIKAMQTDYEERLERLRTEIRELESKQPHKSAAAIELASLTQVSELLNTGLSSLNEVLHKSRSSSLEIDHARILELLQQSGKSNDEKFQGLEGKVSGLVQGLDESVAKKFSLMNEAWKNICAQVRQNANETLQAATSASNTPNKDFERHQVKVEEKLEKLRAIMESIEKNLTNRDEHGPDILKKLNDSEKMMLAELLKMQKFQRKAKESTDAINLDPVVKILESDKDDETRRRERLTTQLKEMRRDMKRVLLETDSFQEKTAKTSMSTDVELKAIAQSIRDLNSQLKFSLISGPNHPDNLAHQFNTSMQQTQAEMEMKMLRDERHALSESMAQLNVEKRKISEEKVHLERQKLDFEKEKDRLKNLEIQLNTKLEETEQMQRKTEQVRREEVQLTSDAQARLRELEKEKQALWSKLQDAELKLRAWEHKLQQEKLEFVREREFVEKLREQLLCPGCLKHNEAAGGPHPPPPPYIPHLSDLPGIATSFRRDPELHESYIRNWIDLKFT